MLFAGHLIFGFVLLRRHDARQVVKNLRAGSGGDKQAGKGGKDQSLRHIIFRPGGRSFAIHKEVPQAGNMRYRPAETGTA